MALNWFYWEYVISGDYFHISVARHSVPVAFWSKSPVLTGFPFYSCISFLRLCFTQVHCRLLLYTEKCHAKYVLSKNRPKHRHNWNKSYREEFLGYMHISFPYTVGQSLAHTAPHSSLALLLPSLTGTLPNTFTVSLTNTLTRRHTRDLCHVSRWMHSSLAVGSAVAARCTGCTFTGSQTLRWGSHEKRGVWTQGGHKKWNAWDNFWSREVH